MTQVTVLLRLAGPLQAWGGSAPWSRRPTHREPTKSGVIGLVGAALGLLRGDELLRTLAQQLTMAVRVDRAGTIMTDFQTVGGGGEGVLTAKRTRKGAPIVKITESTGLPEAELLYRDYLVDASFLVCLGGRRQLVDEIDEALRRPHWPLFLGRACCLPSLPIAAGRGSGGDVVEALQAAPLFPRSDPFPLRIVADGGDLVVMDQIVSARTRRFGPRFVRELTWMPAPPRPTSDINTMEG